jgi:serine/threonine protein kinase/predicted ATPase
MGQTIGNRYEIERELGEGGMGTVYSGIDTQTRTKVAIKKLKTTLDDSEYIERFQREAEALRDLKHPNIVQFLDTLEDADQRYIIMEYVPGGDLSKKLENGALPIAEILRLSIDLCDALTRAHKLNIIHRDLKPANILIAEDGTVRLSDFGVAYLGSKRRVTQADVVVGTIDYLAPEAFDGGQVDKRADIWAVGVILFQMLTGRHPFASDSMSETLNKILVGKIPDIEELAPNAPLPIVDLLYRILTRNPEERIPSIRLVGAELEALLSEDSRTPLRSASKHIDPSRVLSSVFDTDSTPTPQTKHNLPRPGTPFVGRENELRTISALLHDPKVQLVTIIAQGGMGKTRLSIEAAQVQLDFFPQGVYFVELAPLSSAEDIAYAIGGSVNYPFQTGSSPQTQITNYFREKPCLLILDNFEHVLEGRELVQAILQASPTKILVTTRERLNLAAEHLFHLEGFDLANWQTPADAAKYAAVRLFVESANRVRGDFSLETDDLPYVAQICRLVHGLPLGIVLAASWLDTLSLKEISEEIGQNVDFLETTMHDIPERQRSLRAVFEYSWKLLSEAEQQVFASLSVFRGGMSREAAQAISGTNLRALQLLVNKSLLRRDSATGRYEVHEILRQYGEEVLERNGLAQTIRRDHMVYYTNFMTSRASDIKGKRQIPALAEIDADFDNIKSAWRYACQIVDAATISQMMEPIFWYCNFRHRVVEGQELFALARELWHDDSLLAERLLVRYPDADSDPQAIYARGLELARQHDNQYEIAFCLRQLGQWLSHSLSNQDGIALMEESAAIFEQLGESFCLAFVLDDVGWSYRMIGNSDIQLQRVTRCVDLRREIGDKIGMASALRNMGGALGGFVSGNEEPLHKWLEALKLSREIGDKRNIAWNCYMVSVYWQFAGELEKSLPYRQEAFALASEIREQTVYDQCKMSDAIDLILLDADYDRARTILAEAYPPNSPKDLRVMLDSTAQIYLASVALDYVKLRQETLRINQIAKNFRSKLGTLDIYIATIFLQQDGQFEQAAEWMGSYEQTPAHRMTKIWPWYQRYRSALVSTLGQPTFDAAYARGAILDSGELTAESVAYIEKRHA